MITNVSQLARLLVEHPEKACALVDSGVFAWDTELSDHQDRWDLSLFNAAARSPALTEDLVNTARGWFSQQPDGDQRWDDLLWGTRNCNVALLYAFDHGHWDSATVLSRAMHEVRERHHEDVPAMFRPRAWLERWHKQYAQDPQGWRSVASWMTDNGWVSAQDWSTPFDPQDSSGDTYPLQVAMETHGVPEVEHLLKLGAVPRGEVHAPEFVQRLPEPLMFHLLKAWFLGPSAVSRQRQPVLEQGFLSLVKADADAIDAQTVRFRSFSDWPSGLLNAPSLTEVERDRLVQQASAMAPPGAGPCDLPLGLVLRAVGPGPVRSFLEGRLLREDLASSDVEMAPTLARHRL